MTTTHWPNFSSECRNKMSIFALFSAQSNEVAGIRLYSNNNTPLHISDLILKLFVSTCFKGVVSLSY